MIKKKLYLSFFLIFSLFCKCFGNNEFIISDEMNKFYEKGIEKNRLEIGYGRLEKARTEKILDRYLPKAPATILDVGGGNGAYSFSLAKKGYEVYLIEPIPSHIDEAKKINQNQIEGSLKNCIVGDARQIPMPDDSFDVVLFLGPLYHLNSDNRKIALSEAYRVLKPSGILIASGLSKFAPFGPSIEQGKIIDSHISTSISENLETGFLNWKSISFYCHTPDELKKEVKDSGFEKIELLPIEGIGSGHNPKICEDEQILQKLLYFIEKTEKESSILGISNHIMVIGRK